MILAFQFATTTCLHVVCSLQMTNRTDRHKTLMGKNEGSMGEYGWWGNGGIFGSWGKLGQVWGKYGRSGKMCWGVGSVEKYGE